MLIAECSEAELRQPLPKANSHIITKFYHGPITSTSTQATTNAREQRQPTTADNAREQRQPTTAEYDAAHIRKVNQCISFHKKMGHPSTEKAEKLTSVHQNLVCGLQYFGASFGGAPAEFTTTALDGKVAFWSRDEITAAMSALAL